MWERIQILFEKYPLDFITYLSSSLPIISSSFRYKYLTSSSKLITIFFIAFFVKEGFSIYQALLQKNNLYLETIEVTLSIIILLFITLSCFQSRLWKRFNVLLVAILLIINLLHYKNDIVSSVSLLTFRLYAIFFSLSYFNKIIVDVRVKNILLHTLFWFASGLLIFSAGTFFIMLFSEYWFKDMSKVSPEIFDRYWNANQLLFIVFSMLSAYGLWLGRYDRENII